MGFFLGLRVFWALEVFFAGKIWVFRFFFFDLGFVSLDWWFFYVENDYLSRENFGKLTIDFFNYFIFEKENLKI